MLKAQKLTADEQDALAGLESPKVDILAAWANRQLTCSHCGRCTLRCEVLREPGLDIGAVTAAYERLMAVPADERPDATRAVVQERPELYHALRRCCFCGYCTASCAHHVLAVDRMRAWRRLFTEAGLMPLEKLVMVDNEWHIFSAYRAIYGIGYPEFTSLAQAAEHGPGLVDTLFFPGCSLVSYAPDLVRKVGAWLTECGVSWALSDDCCGSPLMSAGLFDRAAALRQRVLDQMLDAGITRMITVCPGCGDEFAELLEGVVEVVPLPELMEQLAADREAAGLPAGLPAASPGSFTVFDSCHDRGDGRHGRAIRSLVGRYAAPAELREIDHRKRGTLCCGAGGAVAAYDDDITQRRVWRVIDEALKTQADMLVTMCPTCTYTIAQALLAAPGTPIASRHYLEVLFGEDIDWQTVFAQLGDMWAGEYGPWLQQTFF
ncbi:MAG: (Fe-S)-binding protein [Eggerthellaceae bacterium]|nr:(Fe-S)-binding protein [Eggerthellaceae bacterium]